MKFKAGDKVWVHVPKQHSRTAVPPPGKYAGEVCEPCETPGFALLNYQQIQWYRIEMEACPSFQWRACEDILEPRHEGYDGDKLGNWDTCPFKPEIVIA